ncbi:MAG: hypothetical protein FWB99_05165 [Treponema sp.]|nr:hypothetical protein [Treponema sp.]
MKEFKIIRNEDEKIDWDKTLEAPVSDFIKESDIDIEEHREGSKKVWALKYHTTSFIVEFAFSEAEGWSLEKAIKCMKNRTLWRDYIKEHKVWSIEETINYFGEDTLADLEDDEDDTL